MSETRTISTTSRRELSSSLFSLQGKAPKEIHAILRETLACFLPGLPKDLSALLNISQSKPVIVNPLTPNDHYSSRTARLTCKRCILYIY